MSQRFSRTTPEEAAVRGALARLGMSEPSASTIIVSASAKCSAGPEQVWQVWSRIQDWPMWSKPLHASARWLDHYAWEIDAKFEEVLNWGFPIGRACGIETVKEIVPGRTVCWWKRAKGTRSCHLWVFEPLPEGGTRIINVEVFRGIFMFFAKPFVRERWQRFFDEAVRNLARTAEREIQPPAPSEEASTTR